MGSNYQVEDLGPADHVAGMQVQDLGPADHAASGVHVEDLGPADGASVSHRAQSHLNTMNAQPLPQTSGPPLGQSAMDTSVGRRLVGSGRSALGVLGGIANAVGAVAQNPSALLHGRQLLDIAQQNTPDPIESAVRVGSAPFAPLTAAAGGMTEDVTGSPLAGDVAELAAGIGAGKVAPGLFGLEEKQPTSFQRPSDEPRVNVNDPLQGGEDWSPFGLSDAELAKVRPEPLDQVDAAEQALRFAAKARNAPKIEDLGPADHVAAPVDLSPEALQAAIRMPDGSVKVTGRNHVIPTGVSPEAVERGFVGKDGQFLTMSDVEGKLRAGTGAGEHEIGQAEIAPPDAATKASALKDFGLDLDAVQGQADKARATLSGDASLLRGGPADHAGAPPELVDEARPGGEAGPAGQVGSRSDALQDGGSAAVRGGREAGTAGEPAADERQRYLDSVAAIEKAANKGPDFGLRLNRSVGPDEPARFADAKLAAKNLRSRHGMNQIAEEAPESAFALRRAANAEGGTKFAVEDTASAVNKIRPGLWDEYKEVKVEGALRDKVRQYRDLAKEAREMPDEQLNDEYADRFRPHLEGIEGSSKFKGKQPVNEADVAFGEGPGKLGDAITKTFEDAAGQVSHIIPEEAYQERRQSPEFKEADKIARVNLLDPAAEAHARNNGSISEYPGEEGYFPLSGKDLPERGLFGLRRGGAYSAPKNPSNKYRTGLSEYDISDEALAQKLQGAARSNETAAAVKQLESEGLIRRLKPGEIPPKTIDYKGKTYRSERVGDHVMPSWVRDEAAPVMENLRQVGVPEGQARKLMNTIVQANMKLGFDKVIHAKNEAGVLTSFAPTLGESKFARSVGNAPVLKQVNAVSLLAKRTMSDIPLSDRPILREMIENGEWMPRLDEKGKLSGMSKLDLAGRIEGRKAFQRWQPGATKQELYDFSTRFGEYNTQLASDMIRSVKKSPTFSPVAPFAVAGNTMRLNAIDSLVGRGTPGGFAGRAASAAGGGLGTGVALWIAAYKAATGQFPWQDTGRMKIGQIPIGQDRDPQTGKERTKYFNMFNAMNPMLSRGLRATGVTGSTETLARGGSMKQAAQQGLGDAINSLMHPILGPAVRFWTRMIFGKDPSLQGTRGVWDAYKGPKTFARNTKSAAEGLNPTLEMAFQTHEKSQNAMDAILQKFGLISYENTVGHAKALKKEQADDARGEKRMKK